MTRSTTKTVLMPQEVTVFRSGDGELHRDNNEPAVVWADGSQFWYQCGELHRDDDRPAVVLESGRKEWWRRGKLHRRDDLPAVIGADGLLVWFKDGKMHRDGGQPAVVKADGTLLYFEHDNNTNRWGVFAAAAFPYLFGKTVAKGEDDERLEIVSTRLDAEISKLLLEDNNSAPELVYVLDEWDAVTAAQQLNGLLRGLSIVQLAQLAKAVQAKLSKIDKMTTSDRERHMWCDGDAVLPLLLNRRHREHYLPIGVKEHGSLKWPQQGIHHCNGDIPVVVQAYVKKNVDVEGKIKDERAASWNCDAAAKKITALVAFLSDSKRDQLVRATVAEGVAKHKIDRWKERDHPFSRPQLVPFVGWSMELSMRQWYLEELLHGRNSATDDAAKYIDSWCNVYGSRAILLSIYAVSATVILFAKKKPMKKKMF